MPTDTIISIVFALDAFIYGGFVLLRATGRGMQLI